MLAGSRILISEVFGDFERKLGTEVKTCARLWSYLLPLQTSLCGMCLPSESHLHVTVNIADQHKSRASDFVKFAHNLLNYKYLP